MTNVLLVDEIEPSAERRLADAARVLRPAGRTVPQLQRAIRGADAVVVRTSPLPAEVLAAGERLRVVGKHGAGLDNVDVAFATRRGIAVVHTPGANATAVAELTVACTLLLLRPILNARAMLRDGRFVAERPLVEQLAERGLIGRELAGRQVGIVGWGAVGRRVGAAFAALGARVLAYDPYVPRDAVAHAAVPAATLEELLARSDVVTVNVSATPETVGLLGERELELLQPHAILVNTSRGSVVDEGALADALRGGRLQAAAVDVFETEPPPPDHPLLQLDNVVCTPHLGGATAEAIARMADEVVDAVLAVLAGQAPPGLVNPEVLSASRSEA